MIQLSTTTCAYDNPVRLYNGKEFDDYEYSSSICTTITQVQDAASTTISISSSSLPLVVGGFTYGDMVITALLFLMFCVSAFGFLWNMLFARRIKEYEL